MPNPTKKEKFLDKINYKTSINDLKVVRFSIPWGIAANLFSRLSRERITKQMFFHAVVDMFLEESMETNLLIDMVRERCVNQGILKNIYAKEKQVRREKERVEKELGRTETLGKEEIENLYDIIEREYAQELEKIK